MAYGRGEDPALSIGAHLDDVDYPVWREQLEKAAMDNGASADVINLFKSLPKGKYESKVDVQRDLAEAGRRFGMGNFKADDGDGAVRDRRNLGKDAAENINRHP